MSPSLSVSGGAGGDSTSGDAKASSSFAPAYGAFNVGGDNQRVSQAGATASATAADTGNLLTYVAIGLAAVSLLLMLRKK